MFKQLSAAALLAFSLAACGGGGSTGGYGSLPVGPTTAPVTAPLSTATLKGSAGFVNSANHTVYVFDADLNTPNASTCNSGCSGVWPPVTVAAGTSLPAPWASFMRGDGRTQLSYQTRAVYTYSGDANPGDTNGDGLNVSGGVWHIARP